MRYDVDCSNPYQSPNVPAAVKPRRGALSYGSRMQAVRGEMWRGAKFGFKVLLVMWGFLLAIWILEFFVGWIVLGNGFVQELLDPSGPFLKELPTILGGGIVAVLAGSALLGAVPGALIMSTWAAIRWRLSPSHHNGAT